MTCGFCRRVATFCVHCLAVLSFYPTQLQGRVGDPLPRVPYIPSLIRWGTYIQAAYLQPYVGSVFACIYTASRIYLYEEASMSDQDLTCKKCGRRSLVWPHQTVRLFVQCTEHWRQQGIMLTLEAQQPTLPCGRTAQMVKSPGR